MGQYLRLVGPNRAVEFLGVKLVGVNAENGAKLLFTLVFIALLLVLSRVLESFVRFALRAHSDQRTQFWARQGIRLTMAVIMLLGLVSIWFDDPSLIT